MPPPREFLFFSPPCQEWKSFFPQGVSYLRYLKRDRGYKYGISKARENPRYSLVHDRSPPRPFSSQEQSKAPRFLHPRPFSRYSLFFSIECCARSILFWPRILQGLQERERLPVEPSISEKQKCLLCNSGALVFSFLWLRFVR